METITTRLPREDAELFAALAAGRDVDEASLLRELVQDELNDWRNQRALEQLANGEATLEEAAETANVDVVEMLSLAAEEGVDIGYSTDNQPAVCDRGWEWASASY